MGSYMAGRSACEMGVYREGERTPDLLQSLRKAKSGLVKLPDLHGSGGILGIGILILLGFALALGLLIYEVVK